MEKSTAGLRVKRPTPFVSVICPTWERSAFLPYLLYMFQYQDHPADRRELIILDDSAISQQPLIDSLLARDPSANVRYIHHPERLKLGKKRNMLNALAQGEYILCMDDDDYYPPDKISWTVAAMQQCGALISGSDRINIWYSHLNRIFKSHSFGKKHLLNGTFCYHRNYLKNHRYDDDVEMGEETSFLNNFSVPVLQLSEEKTILCVSHSSNTFDKNFILPSSEAVSAKLEDIVSDPMLRNHFLSLHNATASKPVQWQSIDQVLVLNLDSRPDRWLTMQEELAALQVPPEKIRRISATPDECGQRGRSLSHLAALTLAQQQGWKNYVLMEDDVRCVKQALTLDAVNRLMSAMQRLPWEVVLFGSHIRTAAPLGSLPGVWKVNQAQEACMYAVNHSYFTDFARLLSESLEGLTRTGDVERFTFDRYWNAEMPQRKWLALSPGFAWQAPGYSDIARQETDSVSHYFSKIMRPASQPDFQVNVPQGENPLANTVAFYMETAFHYSVYEKVIDALVAHGQPCHLMIADSIQPAFVKEMTQFLDNLARPDVAVSLVSVVRKSGLQYGCVVSPYHTPLIAGLGLRNARMIYGLAKDNWGHAWWNVFYDRIYCYGEHTRSRLNLFDTCETVGNPRFDDWYQGKVDSSALDFLKLDAKKPTLLYAPTFGPLSSLPHWAEALSRLQREFNLVVKLHHGTCGKQEEAAALKQAKSLFRKCVSDANLNLPLLQRANYVLSDNSGFIFDAVQAGKKTVLLRLPEQAQKLQQPHSLSNAQSAEQLIQQQLPVADDISGLRQILDPNFDWHQRDEALERIRHHYCDSFQDGQAGQRIAHSLQTLMSEPAGAALAENHFLRSLREKMFG